MQRLLVVLAAALRLAAAIDPPRYPHQPTGNGDTLLTYNVTVGKPGSLSPSSRSLSWVSSENDGEYIFEDTDGSLIFENIATGSQRTFLAADQIPADYWEYWISSDYSRVLWSVNYTKQYRHSYFADYLVQDVSTGETQSLVSGSTGDVQYAEWNPANASQVAFVRGNDLFIWTEGEISQITDSGGPDTFNGVPDWVYEEEIFGDRYTLWWSPDGEYIAYLSMDETGVETFTVPYYMNNEKIAPPYPRELEIRYPKVGTKNPTVGFNLLNVAELKSTPIPVEAFPEDDLVIGEVAWVTDEHEKVIYRAFNRVQDQEKLVTVEVATGSSSVVRERDGTDGWLDDNLAISYVGPIGSGNYSGSAKTYYLDLSDESGWNHIYLFPVNGGDKIALTEGEWEVTSVLKVDSKRGLVYYASTEAHSTERHVYSVSYNTLKKTALVDDSVPAYWSASFSAGGTYYVLTYSGPDVPYQELYSVNSTTPIRTIVDNKKLWDTLQTYNLPNITYMEMEHPDGYTLNAMLRLPANFSPDQKYPVLLTPYGGPGSQEVDKAFQPLSWGAYIASDPELEYITLTVDNRGTGFKGRKFRSLVASNLGELEAKDQVWAAKEIAKYAYVDADKIGIWGWSYGGYLSSKVLELNDDAISLGLITAPVSDWRFYDSMYTERYMKTPTLNPDGYNRSRVHDPAGFNAVRGGFLVMHGTGDDNVHFQNSAALVDLLVGAGVSPEKMSVQWFTDSDHGIRYNGATQFLYRQLTKRLFEEKERQGDLRGGHQWSKRAVDVATAAAAAAIAKVARVWEA